jgi:hypothetical protein
MPRRLTQKVNGLCPWFGLRPRPIRPKAERGAEPHFNHSTDGEAQPRLTSGGKAVTNQPK